MLVQSNQIKFDNVSWSVDAWLEAAILISFIAAILLEDTSYSYWAVYIDPIVLIVLALQMTPSNNTALEPVITPIIVPLTATNDINATDCFSNRCSLERLAANISIITPFYTYIILLYPNIEYF